MKIGGVHILADFSDCEIDLNDKDFLIQLIKQIAQKHELHIVGIIDHQYEPQGISIVALISESHFSIHTWPESKFASCDIYTRADRPIGHFQIYNELSKGLKAKNSNLMIVKRDHGKIKVLNND